MYLATDGRALTSADLESLRKLEQEDYDAIWESLGSEMQEYFQNDKNVMINKFTETRDAADSAFAYAGSTANSYMTSDMARAYKEKLD
jgi:hypothetical protein